MPIRKKCGRVEWAGKYSTKFSGLSETVPDTHKTCRYPEVPIYKHICTHGYLHTGTQIGTIYIHVT